MLQKVSNVHQSSHNVRGCPWFPLLATHGAAAALNAGKELSFCLERLLRVVPRSWPRNSSDDARILWKRDFAFGNRYDSFVREFGVEINVLKLAVTA